MKRLMLKVRMLGQEEITYGDHPILSGKNKITKSMELLLLLLHRRETGIARSRLADALYGVEEVADAGNSLRVTLHRLRKLLLDAGMPEEDFITIREGVYRWSSREEMDVDVWKFRELIEGAEKETDEVRKAELLKAACQMYRGEFLPKLSGQEWALLAAASYKKMYCDALTWIIEWLKKRREYDEILCLVETACRLYPFEEWQTVKIDCYIAQNRYNEAMAEYENTARMLAEELEQLAGKLGDAIHSSLRRGDAFTRYSASQYLVMLGGISWENCQIVISRITDSFTKEHKSWEKRLHCCVTSLYDEEG